MGPSTICEQCEKKLTVFSKRTKCLHCMAAVCKACYTSHVVMRHPTLARSTAESSASATTSRIRDLLTRELTSANNNNNNNNNNNTSSSASDDDVHFLSPDNAHARNAQSFDGSDIDDSDDDDDAQQLDDLDGVEVVSGDDDDDDDDFDDDDDDAVDDDAIDDDDDDIDDDDRDDVGSYVTEDTRRLHQPVRRSTPMPSNRRMSIEQEHVAHTELLAMHAAVATWARKEADATRAQRIAKRDSCYAMSPIPNVRSTREFQEREVFVVAYAVAVTLLVWLAYATAFGAYMRVRTDVLRVVADT